jgi:hypothetical protein
MWVTRRESELLFRSRGFIEGEIRVLRNDGGLYVGWEDCILWEGSNICGLESVLHCDWVWECKWYKCLSGRRDMGGV